MTIQIGIPDLLRASTGSAENFRGVGNYHAPGDLSTEEEVVETNKRLDHQI